MLMKFKKCQKCLNQLMFVFINKMVDLFNQKLNTNKILKRMLKIPSKYKKSYVKYYNNQLYDIDKYNREKEKILFYIFGDKSLQHYNELDKDTHYVVNKGETNNDKQFGGSDAYSDCLQNDPEIKELKAFMEKQFSDVDEVDKLKENFSKEQGQTNKQLDSAKDDLDDAEDKVEKLQKELKTLKKKKLS